MTANEIYKTLTEMRATFPKSSKMSVGFIERADSTGVLEGSTQRGSVIAIKRAWQLENKAPTTRFLPTDEKVIDYVRQVAASAEKAACKLLIVIDLQHNSTDLWVISKSGSCFIATAACGDSLAPEVLFLSDFRDESLARQTTGLAFIRLYNLVSPPLAAVIARYGWMRSVALLVIVKPAVRIVRIWQGSWRSRVR